ncbi:MAG: AAA family ATPase [Candidatus Thiodiazotropha sp.]|nr:AAA family ATPase [Candidatus Thiodiazotropha sp.]MCM8883212.1 AAA family ATPase [Candidatus Thiodiazotropha sp.]
MKRLTRLLLINWYRLDQISIEINGHTAFIGPNASGKSSLLDAIQAVLVGGSKQWWSPNASAGEKSTRSLRDYCLGVVRDPDNPDLSLEFRPRDQALTYLVLVFEEENGEPISIGVAMHARLEEAQETIDGRFIAPGLDLILSDLVDRTGGELVPKPWKRLREELRSRAGERFRAPPQVGEYQREVCAVLSDGKRHLDPPRFLRAFKNAITFSPIRNVSDFVRGHILEERPIQVRSLQEALHHYRDIQARTKEARQREEALSAINAQYQKAEQSERLGMAWRWVAKEAEFSAFDAEIEPLREIIEGTEQQIAKLEERIDVLKAEWEKADTALEEANKKLAATDVEQQRLRIKAQRSFAEQKVTNIETDLAQVRSGLGRVHQLLDYAEHLPSSELVLGLRQIPPLIEQGEGLLVSEWPMAPADLMRLVSKVGPLLQEASAELSERYEALVREEGELKENNAAIRERIARLEAGGSDLQPGTLKLIKLLNDHGIEAVPVCDRVDVADEAWRNALESFLGGHREALLVDPLQVRDAVSLYRREGKRLGIHGSRIVNTTKTEQWLERLRSGSLAEMAVTEDQHAQAYINLRAGNVIRVDSEEELMQHDRAITVDGMLATGGAVLRLRPEEPMLGRKAREKTLELLKAKFAEQGSKQYDKQQEKASVKRLREELVMPLDEHIKTLPDLESLVQVRRYELDEVQRLDREEQGLLDDSAYQMAVDNVAKCRQQREVIGGEQSSANTTRTSLTRQLDSDKGKLTQAETGSSRLAEERSAIQAMAAFDAQLAAEKLDELSSQEMFADESVESLRALNDKATSLAGASESRVRNQRSSAREELAEYWSAWGTENRPVSGSFDDYLPLATWVVSELRQIQETQLSQYVKEAENALRQAEHAFRADFVGKLQENLHLLDEQLKELNRNLKNRPFHGQYYRFIKTPESDVKEVLDWVLDWKPEQGGDVGGLFDAADDPNHPHSKAIARVRNLLMEAADADGKGGGEWEVRLADYRNYYHFDVRMSDDKDGSGNTELLSRRLGKGSGGEHQSPFYVAIGAALAAAYRIEREENGGFRGGMGIAVFDEAFSKLDLQNTVSALGFLDELGLQVLLAAPDEKYGQIAEHVDTIVNVYRDGPVVHIDTEYIKPAARQVLASDNPVIRPDT